MSNEKAKQWKRYNPCGSTHTHTHTGSVSGYLTYKKIDIEKMKAHVLYMFFNDLENV